ncbi:MAG: aldolase/citrate lyase family protein [Firmicutes bacterium]|nr:aldolase/citrate lyase family protein [Bacillota bacterium]
MRKDILNHEIKVGGWIQIGSPVSGEILAKAGFDWIAIDLEHTEIELKDFTNIMRGISRYNVFPMARVCKNSTISIRKCLDCGAKGIIVPLINTKAEAESAVRACKFPPDGVRGFAFARANEWGVGFDEYAKTANDEIVVMIMIETKEAVENIEEIVSVEGVDGVFIGHYDLSGSYGVPGETEHTYITEAKDKVLRACKKYNKVIGQHIVLPTEENVKIAVESGYTFLALGIDTVFISAGAKTALNMVKRCETKVTVGGNQWQTYL